MIEIFCVNNNTKKNYPLGTTLSEIANDLQIESDDKLCGTLVNNRVKPLDQQMVKSTTIEFFTYAHPEGRRMYFRSLSFLLYAAVKEIFPEAKLRIDHAISRGYFCEIEDLGRPLMDEDVWSIREEMNALISADIPFKRLRVETKNAVSKLSEVGLNRKAKLFKHFGRLYAPLHALNEKINFYYGHLVPSTGFLQSYGLIPYFDGILLRLPTPTNHGELEEIVEQDKLFEIIREHKNWASILGIKDVSKLNKVAHQGRANDLIRISEALHERKVSEIAKQIQKLENHPHLVLIAGPSSSGKTTFSKRLAVQLAVSGIRPHLLSLDDYFVNREDTPKDETGEFDFENLHAVDIPFFNLQLNELLEGKEIEIPRFDFVSGTRVFRDEKLKIGEKDILIIEGIHALNPELIPDINQSEIFKIFISALTQISIDEHNYIPSTDNRLIRRIIRDSKYRNYSAQDTIQRWASVRRGEEKNIFPHQENADVMFNSALLYELSVLKPHLEPRLKQVKENQKEYTEAVRLLNFIAYFDCIAEEEVPHTSILREFLGGSSFGY